MTTDQKLALIKVEDVKVGTKLKADGGFTCLCEGEIVTVEQDEDGELFVYCAGEDDGENKNPDYGKPSTTSRLGTHMLDGQLSGGGKDYVGFYLVEK